MHSEFVILGGGAAGLSAALRLAELRVASVLIDAGTYPTHKVCGEFFSPVCLKILQEWNIKPVPIIRTHFYTAHHHCTFDFPTPAGSLSHLSFDPSLAAKAANYGVNLLLNTRVESLQAATTEGQCHRLILSTGEVILARHLLIATGRIPSVENAKMSYAPLYVGIKAHFCNLGLTDSLEMFSFQGAYAGVSPLEEGRFNVACLARADLLRAAGDVSTLIQRLQIENPQFGYLLKKGKNLFDTWMHVFIPSLGLRTTPSWPRTYFIGDAAGTIPPACGSGLALALIGGRLAAEYAYRNDARGFYNIWQKRLRSSIRWGKFLHALMLHPQWANQWMYLHRLWPSLSNSIFANTR